MLCPTCGTVLVCFGRMYSLVSSSRVVYQYVCPKCGYVTVVGGDYSGE